MCELLSTTGFCVRHIQRRIKTVQLEEEEEDEDGGGLYASSGLMFFFFFSVAAPVQSKSALIASVSGPSETQSSPAAICSVRGEAGWWGGGVKGTGVCYGSVKLPFCLVQVKRRRASVPVISLTIAYILCVFLLKVIFLSVRNGLK